MTRFKPIGFPDLHLAGTTGAQDVDTVECKRIRLAVKQAHALRGIVAIEGESGLGKTFAAGRAIRMLGFPHAYSETPPTPTGKEYEASFLEAIDADFDEEATRAAMRRSAKKLCKGNRFVYAHDEIERAAAYGIEIVRYIWAAKGNQTTFVLIGHRLMPFLDANPALRGRITRKIVLRPWTFEQTEPTMRAYHAVYRDATQAVLRYAFDVYAGGYFRQWAHLLEALLLVIAKGAPAKLTTAMIDEAIDLLNAE